MIEGIDSHSVGSSHERHEAQEAGIFSKIKNWFKGRISSIINLGDEDHGHNTHHGNHHVNHGDHVVKDSDENKPANDVERKDILPGVSVKVVGKSKNSGDVIGMTKSFQKKHHVKPGDTVGVVRGGMRHLQLIVEDIDPEFEKKGEDVVTVNIDNGKERNIFLDFSSKVHENEEKKAA